MKFRTVFAVMLFAALALAGCGGSSSHIAVPTATSSEQSAALTAAQATIGKCVAKEHTVRKIMDCVAPAGEKQAFKTCALAALSKEHVTTKEGRQKLYREDWPRCLVQVQATGTQSASPVSS